MAGIFVLRRSYSDVGSGKTGPSPRISKASLCSVLPAWDCHRAVGVGGGAAVTQGWFTALGWGNE